MLPFGGSCVNKPVHHQDWLEVRTRHFDISSSLGPEATTRLANDLENFRLSVEYLIDADVPPLAIRTKVYAFDGRRVVRPFDRRGASGYFLPSLDGGRIVLRTGGGWRRDATVDLKLEFARFLFRNREGLDRPLWYDEGFGQFVSTMKAQDGAMEIGLARPDQIALLRDRLQLSVERLIQLQDLTELSKHEREIFNAESWALVHYLTFGKGHPAQARKRFRRYFDLLEQGTSYPKALQKAFGETPSEIKKGLSGYVREQEFGSMTMRIPQRRAKVPTPRRLEPANAATRLGWLAVALGRAKIALGYFERALEPDPENPSAMAGLVASARIQQDWKSAEARYARAQEVAPNHSLMHLEGGRAALAEARETASPRDQTRLTALAQQRFRKSIDELGTNPEAYALLGSSYLLPGEDPARGVAPLIRAQALLPSSLEIELIRARIELARGEASFAALLARGIASRTTSKKLAEESLALAEEAERGRKTGR